MILSHLDVFSLYSNGQMHSGEDYQTIYVAQFEFTKNANIVISDVQCVNLNKRSNCGVPIWSSRQVKSDTIVVS